MAWCMQPRLRARPVYDGKWSKIDLQSTFAKERLPELWNELVKDGEISALANDGLTNKHGLIARKGVNGLYYCGMPLAAGCEGRCALTSSSNCEACQRLDDEERERSTSSDHPRPSAALVDSWVWGKRPEVKQLKECVRSLLYEQQQLCLEALATTLSCRRLRERLAVFERYFVALPRQPPDGGKVSRQKTHSIQTNLKRQCVSKPIERATTNLAKVGSHAAMGFAFAFLRRAWRTGEDSDLCFELLSESLVALRSLPEATLFDESSVSPVWLEVVDKASRFLRSVVVG